ncbi:MAG: non-canonical purine NTP diphosphatase [Flavobacteriia bacterium]|jgi:XTP/dITP diphosphohydrolase
MKLVFATHNSHKAKEIQSIMPEGIEIITLDEIGCHEEIPETATTLEGNATIKAKYIADRYHMNCFADDTGLEIKALNGEPGVYSARYAGEEKNPKANMELVLRKLENENDRKARFRTSIALYLDGELFHFDGIVNGVITTLGRGNEGFGYDPIFEPEQCGKTFAEMELSEKNTMSHRARAVTQMIDFLKNYL